MDRILDMEYLYLDQVIAHIQVHNELVSCENYTDDIVQKPFGKIEEPTYKNFLRFLEKRCFPRTRFNCKQILKDMELERYDPFEIVKQTHGAMWDDCFWLRFAGENLKWEDVNPRVKSLGCMKVTELHGHTDEEN